MGQIFFYMIKMKHPAEHLRCYGRAVPAYLSSKIGKIWEIIISHIMLNPEIGSKQFSFLLQMNPPREAVRSCGGAIPAYLPSKIDKIWEITTWFIMQSVKIRLKQIFFHIVNNSSMRAPKMLWTSHSSTTRKVKRCFCVSAKLYILYLTFSLLLNFKYYHIEVLF